MTTLALVGLLGAWTLAPRQPAFVWVEGESAEVVRGPVTMASVERAALLSGGRWAHVGIDAEQVAARAPDGAEIRLRVESPSAGKRQLWARIGFEFARSPFEWRFGDGPWRRVSREDLTTDLVELGTWTEAGWLKLGEVEVAGPTDLRFRVSPTRDSQDRPERLLFGLDAVCLTVGDFHPNGHLKPGEVRGHPDDAAAAQKVFEVPPVPADGARVSLRLNGLWEIARHDEVLPSRVDVPIAELPQNPIWTGIPVPGDRNTLRPDLIFAHRFWYRTRIRVPESATGRSFHLVFPQNNLNTTVFVNGVYCGFDKNPFARLQIDVTAGMRPGLNEVMVGIRDAWYAYSFNPRDPMKLRRRFNLPLSVTRSGFQELAYPIFPHFESGILKTPELVVAGPVKAVDVFAKTSVSRRRLDTEVEILNTTSGPVSGQLVAEVVDPETGTVALRLPDQNFQLDSGKTTVLKPESPWAEPKLWWPDEPHMYRLRTTVRIDGKAVDVSETPFGFREWTWSDKRFRLNGIPWRGWADTHSHVTPEAWLEHYRKSNQTMMRFWGLDWMGMDPNDALSWFDRHGIPVRRSGMLDGQVIGYIPIEQDPDLQEPGTVVKMDLMRNWRDQMLAQVKGERNHPSIFVWSIENEWLYINCLNLWGNYMDQFEAEVKKVSDAVMALDPTRPTKTDGGGANKDQSMPVHGNHYVFDVSGRGYPGLAYEANPTGGGRGRWVWDQQRPRFLGEDFFANGINPFDYGTFGGESAFQGKAQSRPAAGRIYRMLTEGYRWAEYAAWHFWMQQHEAVDQYASNAPVAAFVRQWDWTFGSGQTVPRTIGLFNDTRFGGPLEFGWELVVGGRPVGSNRQTFDVPAGTNRKFDIELRMPTVNTRTEGVLTLTVRREGREVFRDTKAVSVLPAPSARPARTAGPAVPALTARTLAVWDPSGKVARFLRSVDQPFSEIGGPGQVDSSVRVLVVGPDALDAVEAANASLAALASRGMRVVVLEQRHPLRYQGLPAEMAAQENAGAMAYIENSAHPVVSGLQDKDFWTWSPRERLYRNAYAKPTSGAKSIVHCGTRLANSALAEIPVDTGLLVVCQLEVGEGLADNAVARQLFANLLAYANAYRFETRPVVVVQRDLGPIGSVVQATGVVSTTSPTVSDAVRDGRPKTIVVSATPANLRELVAAGPALERFLSGGGWVVLNGLTPEGIDEFNKLVRQKHMIRPFRRERVAFPPRRHPLTAGLTLADVVMQSGERINTFTSDLFLASDVFSYVVDLDEVAPFAELPSHTYFGYDAPQNDHDPFNMVNGFVSADGWQLIFSINHQTMPTQFDLKWPTPQEFRQIEWTGNGFYDLVTKIELTFDGAGEPVVFRTQPNTEPQTFDIQPPRTASKVTVKLAEWERRAEIPVIGVDNLRLFVSRPSGFQKAVQPMLNVGALVAYPRGRGGVVLANVLFQERESVPDNAVKKRRILATVLRNLQAPFSGAAPVIAGGDLVYAPIDVSGRANAFVNERGWFGDPNFTFRDLPRGRQTMAGIPFEVYEFLTSPVPTAIMLGGPNVPGNLPDAVREIPVGRRADALFFLVAARIDSRRSPNEVREGRQFEIARIEVRYADGQTESVPIRSETDVEHFRQAEPTPVPGAQIGWVGRYPNGESAVAYVLTWVNPRPNVPVVSFDLVRGRDPRGVPAILAVTAGNRRSGGR